MRDTKSCPALKYDVPDRRMKCFITGTECNYMCKENCLDYRNYVERPAIPRISEVKHILRGVR